MPAKRTTSGPEAAFTLAEVMLASAMLVLVLISVLGVTMHSFRYLADAPLKAQSSEFLQEEMEQIRLLGWNDVLALSNTFTNARNISNAFTGTLKFSTNATFNGTPTAVRLTLTARWAASHGMQSNSVTTVVGNGGINTFIY